MLGIAAWFWLPDRPQWSAFLLLAAGLGLGLLALAPGTRWGRALAIFGLAAALGLRPDLVEGRAAPPRRGSRASG